MYSGCTSLANVKTVELYVYDAARYEKAGFVTKSCFAGMYMNCTSLTAAPELPATSLADSCYNYMFSGCSSLIQSPAIKTYTPNLYAFSYMLNTLSYTTYKWSLTSCNWPDLTIAEAESMVLRESIFGNDNPGASVRISITCKDGSGTAYYDSGKSSWVFEY